MASTTSATEDTASGGPLATPEPDLRGPATPSTPRSRRVVTALCVAVVAAVEAVAGWYLYFSTLQFPSIDDEGYVVTIVREWTGGGALYDEVFSQYGPFHTVVFGLPLRLLGIDLTLTSGRILTLTVTVLTSVLFAGVVWVLTRNLPATLIAQLGSFMLLDSLAGVAMHPASLVALLLALLVLNVSALRPRAPDASDLLTGALLAALVLTKVNVGIFAVLAVAYLVAWGWPSPRVRRVLLPLTEIAIVAVGPFLLLRHLGVLDDARTFGVPHDGDRLYYWSVAYVAFAVLALGFGRLQRGPRVERSRPLAVLPLLLGFGALSALTLAVVLATGTTITAVVESVLVRPLGTGDALTILGLVPVGGLAWIAVVPLLLLLGWTLVRAPSTRAWLVASGTLRVAAGAVVLVIAVITTIDETYRFQFAGELVFLPIIAVVLLPRVGEGAVRNLQARQLLTVLCVTQSLHAFPIAAVQKDLSVLLPAVAAAVALADGGLEWQAALGAPAPATRARLLAAAPAALALLALVWYSADDLGRWRDQYLDGTPIDRPGADDIRGPESAVAALDSALALLDGCDQFAMYPAWNSFYLLTGTSPPTGYNATIWEELLTDEEQQRTIDALEAADGRVCFLRLVGFPATDAEEQPLLVYLDTYEPADTDGTFELFVRPDS